MKALRGGVLGVGRKIEIKRYVVGLCCAFLYVGPEVSSQPDIAQGRGKRGEMEQVRGVFGH
jgi:hypothetical protein